MAINQAKNAGILAACILGTGDDELRGRVADYKSAMASEVEQKAQRLETEGWRRYLDG